MRKINLCLLLLAACSVLTVLIIMLPMPDFASAFNYWNITVSTSPGISGAVTPPLSGPDYSTSGNTTYVTTNGLNTADFTVNPAPTGYILSYVKIDGVTTAPYSGNTYRVNKGATTTHTLSATFAVKSFTITTNKTGNGTIDSTVSVPYGSSKTINMAAGPGYKIASVAAGGATLTGGDGVNTASYTFANIQADASISVTFAVIPVVAAIISNSSQSIVNGTSITIDGSASTYSVTPTYTWSVTPAGATLTPASDGKTSVFSAPTAGIWTVQLALSAAGATTSTATVTITTITKAELDSKVCIDCHAARNPTTIVAGYLASTHKTTATVSCQSCHDPTGTVPHYFNILHTTVSQTTFKFLDASAGPVGTNFCFTCHHKGNNLHYNTEAQLADICVTCHPPDVHNPAATMTLPLGAQHFNGYTSPANINYRAAYVTPTTQCANCHITTAIVPNSTDPLLLQQRLDWAVSGHGNTSGQSWLAYDFKTLSGCVQCHTTAGFIAYSSSRMTAAWGTPSKTREVLSCNGCHTDIGSGSLRTSLPIQPYANDPYTNPNLGNTTNLCLKCHSGMQSGRSIKALAAAAADFTNLAFIGSHSSAAAGILFKSIGYEFNGRDYNNKWHFKHDRIGISHYTAYGYDTGSDGPCVGCHMNSPNKHTFSPLARNAGGAVTAITSLSCAGCHTGPAYLDGGRMNSREVKFASALLALQKILETRGIFYANVAPYFFKNAGNSSPGNAVKNWGNADTMGAAFNFNLLQHEPGAYAHNMIYAKRLIYDSIDYLDNGAFDNSVSTAINGLAGLNSTQKATAIDYLAPTGNRP